MQDFFDQFEKSTQGENFRHPSVPDKADKNIQRNSTDDNKDDLSAFMDEFERTTQGENLRRHH